jgi:hypothetical protein
MPTIDPPKDDDIKFLYVEEEQASFTQEQYDYIQWRLSQPSWICPACGQNNHHFNKYCANFRCRIINPNPINER